MCAKPLDTATIASLKPAKSSGEILKVDGEIWYKISNCDSIPPFFMTITSSSDAWNFIWSTGAISAGRKDANHAIFPYYTSDKIDDLSGSTGSYAAVKILDEGKKYLWEPFAKKSSWSKTRNLYKNSSGSHIIFEEINKEYNLSYRIEWTSSDKYGLVKIASIKNLSEKPVKVEILDGCQNIMPACSLSDTQNSTSNLLDAYKKSDLDTNTGLALFAMSSVLTDRAEPSEALYANTCWFSKKSPVYLAPETPELFATDEKLTEESVLKGFRSSAFITINEELKAGASDKWEQVFDTRLEISAISNLQKELSNRAAIEKSLFEDVEAGKKLLDKYIGDADGIQNTADEICCMHHKANVMFNIMRGGVFAENNTVHVSDFKDFIKTRNNQQLPSVEALGLGETVSYLELGEKVKGSGNDQLYRLYLEYLPLSFSRRHGDPSRPWNKFSINLKDSLGNPILNYEGNWRDIFQNWEALAMSYPAYTTGMIAKFLNAVTADGFNPYRITRNGLDWEIPDPTNPWSNIGYWNDHQVIYLCKLLELQEQLDPASIDELLNKKLFSSSNVPYHIKPFEDLLKNPRDTIVFDSELNKKIVAETKKFGTDSKLVGKDGSPYMVTLTAKLLQLMLAKLANYVPCGGIWLNTQRPEWNDANNALAGYGLSVVTLCYLRRMLNFTKNVFAASSADSFQIPQVLKEFFETVKAAFKESKPENLIDSKAKAAFVSKVGKAFSDERQKLYADGSLLVTDASVSKAELLDAIDAFLVHAEYSIKANRRSDGLYHSYNTLTIGKDTMEVAYLQEMLEGQVAVLSSGLLSGEEVADLCASLKASKMYEKRQNSFMLYPSKELPAFVNKNAVSKAKAKAASEILSKELSRGYKVPDANCIIYNDSVDSEKCHFNPDFRNAEVLSNKLMAVYPSVSADEKAKILALYEETFNHKSFTGRSGTFYAFEGIGSIYWHMCSKLLLAVQENFNASLKGGDKALTSRLAHCYYDVRSGLSFNKTPEIYGAFPTDPYSHTPWQQGAKQPGMTGQVKEEVITRWGELGMQIEGGKLKFNTALLDKKEFGSDGKLSFTRFGVEFQYNLNGSISECKVKVDGKEYGAEIPAEVSKLLFQRNGGVSKVVVEVPESVLYRA